MNKALIAVAAILLPSCELATTDAPVPAQDRQFALQLIRDQGLRCQKITSIAEKATIEGWRVQCYAEALGSERTNWPYEVTKMPRGWVASSWKVNSELPVRCQKNPDEPC